MAISFVVSTAQGLGFNGGTTGTPIDTSGATPNGFIGVVVSDFDVVTASQPVTDNKGNTYTALTAVSDGGSGASGFMRSRISYVNNPTVGSGHTFTNSGSTLINAISVMAFSGVDVFNAEGAGGIGTVITTLQPGSVTPFASDLFLTGITWNETNSGDSGLGVQSIDSSFIGLVQAPGISNNNIGSAMAYKVSGSAENPTWTNTKASGEAAVIASFKAAAGGGGNVVSGGVTEGADATGGGSIKVAVKASGGVTEGKDATSGTIKLASKVSGGATEGPDATAGSVKVALKVSGGVTEGADFTTGAISVGSTHVSGNLTEGAEATGGGSVKVALHVSGAITEGRDATAGNLLVAVKVSGGVTEGADFTTGSITATSRTISGGFTEGADRTSGIILSGTVSQGGHFLPLTKKEIAEARKRAKAARDKEEAGWDQAAKDKADLHQQIMKTLHPEKILGIGKVEKPEEDDDEADIEMLLLYG